MKVASLIWPIKESSLAFMITNLLWKSVHSMIYNSGDRYGAVTIYLPGCGGKTMALINSATILSLKFSVKMRNNWALSGKH